MNSREIIDQITNAYEARYGDDNKIHFFYWPRSNFRDIKNKTLERIIRHSLSGGTFFFGTNRAYDVLKDQLKWIDEDNNTTQNCPPIFCQVWNKITKPDKTTRIQVERNNILKEIDAEITRLKRSGSWWGGSDTKIVAYEKLKSMFAERKDESIAEILQRASKIKLIKWRENKTVETKINNKWVTTTHPAMTEATIQDVLTWRQFRWDLFSSDSADFWKKIYDKHCVDEIGNIHKAECV